MTIASPPDTDAGSGRGWFIALGVVLFILGLVALYNAIDATLVTTIIVGWLLVIAGVANIVGAFMSGAGGWWRASHVRRRHAGPGRHGAVAVQP